MFKIICYGQRAISVCGNTVISLAKPDDGLDESPNCYGWRGQQTTKQQLGKNRGILKPSWAFVETNNLH